jgi:hypothetical protein
VIQKRPLRMSSNPKMTNGIPITSPITVKHKTTPIIRSIIPSVIATTLPTSSKIPLTRRHRAIKGHRIQGVLPFSSDMGIINNLTTSLFINARGVVYAITSDESYGKNNRDINTHPKIKCEKGNHTHRTAPHSILPSAFSPTAKDGSDSGKQHRLLRKL